MMLPFPLPRPSVPPAPVLPSRLRALHASEQGADEGMNKLLIFAMVALPLLALLIIFGGDVLEFAQERFDEVFDPGGVEMPQQ